MLKDETRNNLFNKLYDLDTPWDDVAAFNYDAISAPPILYLLTPTDLGDLNEIATSLKYNGQIEKKYAMIDSIMARRGFKFAHRGTNRCVYNFLDLRSFVAKIALDRVGAKDNPAELKNQHYIKPFCCKVHEVTQDGIVAFVERVIPVTTMYDFSLIIYEVYNLLTKLIIGKYVVDDMGVTKYMNYGVRPNFGPVVLDFPYMFELDGNKLKCNRLIDTPMGKVPCMGDIDYDDGFDHLYCTKCGKTYHARDLMKKDNGIVMFRGSSKGGYKMGARIVNKATGKVLMSSGRSSDNYVSKEDYQDVTYERDPNVREYPVRNTIKKEKIRTLTQAANNINYNLRLSVYNNIQKANKEREKFTKSVPVSRTIKREDLESGKVTFDADEYLNHDNDTNNNTSVEDNDIIAEMEANVAPEMANEVTDQNSNQEEEVISLEENINTEENIDISNDESAQEDGLDTDTEASEDDSSGEIADDDSNIAYEIAKEINDTSVDYPEIMYLMTGEHELEEDNTSLEAEIVRKMKNNNILPADINEILVNEFGWIDSDESQKPVVEEEDEYNEDKYADKRKRKKKGKYNKNEMSDF